MAEGRSWRRGRKKHFSGSKRPNPCKLFVGNISFEASEEQLKEVLAELGPVRYCRIVRDRKSGRSKGHGFVVFESVSSVERALLSTDHRLTLNGRVLRIERPASKKELSNVQSVTSSAECEEVKCEVGECGTGECGDVSVKQRSLSETQETLPVLNDDVLLLVMRYLTIKDRIRIERVSRRWWCVAKASWQNVHHISFENCFRGPFQGEGKYSVLSDDILHSVLKRGGKGVVSLDLSCNTKFVTDFGLDLIGMYCGGLERLDLSGATLTQAVIQNLSHCCPHLKWLRACGCHTVGEKSVWRALQNWKNLEFLDVGNNWRITGQFFIQARQTLCHVHLQHCTKLVDGSVELLAGRCPQLRTLDISHCPSLTGASLRSISKHCREMRVLKFKGPNHGVTVSDIASVALLHRLEVLVVDQQATFDNDTLKLMGINCPNLTTLSCAACHQVTDVGLSSLSRCHRLNDMNISYCAVTDQGLAALLNPDMRRLCIRDCHGITDNGIVLVARTCPRLELLDVCGCHLSLSESCLPPLQDSLLQQPRAFSLLAGGTSIADEVLKSFASVTGAVLTLTDFSIPSLSANYIPHELDCFNFLSDEDDVSEHWQLEEACPATDSDPAHQPHPPPEEQYRLPLPHLGADYNTTTSQDDDDDGLLDAFLVADDPAFFSDEFSGPEDWGLS